MTSCLLHWLNHVDPNQNISVCFANADLFERDVTQHTNMQQQNKVVQNALFLHQDMLKIRPGQSANCKN